VSYVGGDVFAGLAPESPGVGRRGLFVCRAGAGGRPNRGRNQLNPHFKKTFVALALVFAGACTFLFNIFYQEARTTAIAKLHEEQMIHAKQAAQGIEDFFDAWTRNLSALAKTDEIVDNDAVGQHYLKLFFEANESQILSITRVDEKGIITFNFPKSSSVGKDISRQKHIRELLRDHQPVISDVFRAIEGFDTVAVYVPVFQGSEFKGGIAILVNFKTIANRYLDVIKIGNTGYAWVISRDGTILYSPVTGLAGKSVFETTKDSPSLDVMVNDMLKEHEGATIYTFDRIGDRNVGPTRKYAVYMPVHIGNTFWSIAVASAEQDVLSGLNSFRNKLALVIGALFICGMVFSTLGAKAWLIVKEEEKRKLTEAKLQESVERFRQVAETAGEFIWEVNAEGLYTYASPSVEKTLGYTADELVGKKHFYDLFIPSSRDELKAAAFQVFAHRQTFRDFPNTNVSKSGKIVHLETSGTPVLDSSGNLVGYRGADTDVTARKQSELELGQQRNELAHLSRVSTMGVLTSSLAHELNQPLTAILSNAQAGSRFLAGATPDLAEIRGALEDIAQDAKRAGEVIRQMRALVRKDEPQLEPLDLNHVISDVVRLLHSDMLVRKVQIALELAPELRTANGDNAQLQQVMLNLVLNAFDAMKDVPEGKRTVIVRTRQLDAASLRVEVSDVGTGISPDRLANLFEPFRSSKREGLGLGLSISRSIVEAHKGRLWAENNPGHGATLYFTLPVQENELKLA
jgi:PAS domain S-box-containing protein